jgi:DNA polymerase (family 10)
MYNKVVKIHKKMTNLEIAELLRAVAAAYQVKGKKKNFFKIVAYQRAADAVEHLSSEAKDLWDDNNLAKVSGIGVSIEAHLDEIFRTGKSKHFKSVMLGVPPATFELIKVSGIGPKTAYMLANKFKSKISVSNPLRSLEKLAKSGEIAKLEGMGRDSQEAILKALKDLKGRKKRLLLNYATQVASEIVEWMKKEKAVVKIDTLGSLRRKSSTVGDIDIAVASKDAKAVIDHFSKYPKASRVLEKGERTASIILPGEIKQVDLMVQEPKSYGSLLQHFTGSKHHNIALREYAKSLSPSLSLSEYGIRKLKAQNSELKTFKTEEELYKYLGMGWIAPELREDKGEIAKALKNDLPKLVELKDTKADLQLHSNFDIETSHDLGESSMEEIVEKANDLGYEYIALTEHNPSRSKHKDSQVIDLLKRKKEKVDKINYSIQKIERSRVKKVFNSLEIDIMPDGKLPVSNEGLELLDFALISIHSSFLQGRKNLTKRVLTAFSHPNVKIFAHPTARKLNQREGVELDWEKIFQFCVDNSKWLEINADPMRLDLPDVLVKQAIDAGVKLTLGTDAHHVNSMDNMVFGVSVARRGWAESAEIINTRSLKEFEKMIE